MNSGTRVLLIGLCIASLVVLAVPAASALDASQPWKDNPEHVTAMQAYVAYQGEQFKAKMDGAIQYVGTLNGSVSTASLQSDEQQFLATVSSVTSMTTADAITQAMQTMKTEIAQYRTDLRTALAAGKGSGADLKTAVDGAVTADQANIQNLENAYWSARETSRIDEFNYNDARRTGVLANLTAKGIDATPAQSIETQIQGEGASLKTAFDARNEAQLRDANTQLATLTQQFGKEVQSLAWQARETARLARFDNTTTRIQDRLTNLSARGLDVSGAQGVLSQIIALRPQIETALENHDETTLRGLNSQLISLDQQLNQDLRQALSQARAQRTPRTPGARPMFNRTGSNGPNMGPTAGTTEETSPASGGT